MANVDLEDQVFHIRAGLKHVRGVLCAIERKGQNFVAVRVIDMNGDIDILIFVCIVDRLGCASNLQRTLYLVNNDVGVITADFCIAKRIILIGFFAGQVAFYRSVIKVFIIALVGSAHCGRKVVQRQPIISRDCGTCRAHRV